MRLPSLVNAALGLFRRETAVWETASVDENNLLLLALRLDPGAGYAALLISLSGVTQRLESAALSP